MPRLLEDFTVASIKFLPVISPLARHHLPRINVNILVFQSPPCFAHIFGLNFTRLCMHFDDCSAAQIGCKIYANKCPEVYGKNCLKNKFEKFAFIPAFQLGKSLKWVSFDV